MRARILIDCDGVMGDFISPCLQTVYECTGKRYTYADINDWDIMKSLGIDHDTSKNILKAMERPGLCLGIPAYDGAREGVERLRKFADVWAVTSPFGGEHWMHERDQWLVEQMGFHKDDVLHVRSTRKHGIYGDVLVEDKTETLVDWTKQHPGGYGILFLRNYNKNDGYTGPTASDWPTLVDKIRDYLLEIKR